MALAQQQPLTLDEFLQLPEEKPALEFEDGRVSQKVSPKGRHSTLQGEIYDRVNAFARPRKLARAYTELRTTFGGFSRVPDVSAYVWDRIPVTAEGKVADDFTLPPDIAIEIVSPTQSVNALVRRCLWYVRNSVRVALLVDPADESVLIFRAGRVPRVLRGNDAIDVDDFLPGFRLTVEELFDSLSLR